MRNETGHMECQKILGKYRFKIRFNQMNELRLICYQNLQKENQECPDFEIRFCCAENLNQTSSEIISLNYSMHDFGEEELQIRQSLKISNL